MWNHGDWSLAAHVAIRNVTPRLQCFSHAFPGTHSSHICLKEQTAQFQPALSVLCVQALNLYTSLQFRFSFWQQNNSVVTNDRLVYDCLVLVRCSVHEAVGNVPWFGVEICVSIFCFSSSSGAYLGTCDEMICGPNILHLQFCTAEFSRFCRISS